MSHFLIAVYCKEKKWLERSVCGARMYIICLSPIFYLRLHLNPTFHSGNVVVLQPIGLGQVYKYIWGF